MSSVAACAFNEITTTYWHFRSVLEEDVDKVLKTSRFVLKQLDYSLSISIAR